MKSPRMRSKMYKCDLVMNIPLLFIKITITHFHPVPYTKKRLNEIDGEIMDVNWQDEKMHWCSQSCEYPYWDGRYHEDTSMWKNVRVRVSYFKE